MYIVAITENDWQDLKEIRLSSLRDPPRPLDFPMIIRQRIGSSERQRGIMCEAISGAPLIKESEDIAYAYERFRESMINFQSYDGRLAEHFAYGSLTKQEYERAHAMHFYNHLLEIELTS